MFGSVKISSSFPRETPSDSGIKTLKSPSENWTLNSLPVRAESEDVSVSHPKIRACESFLYAVSISCFVRATKIFTGFNFNRRFTNAEIKELFARE
jgi:hypothetical protein